VGGPVAKGAGPGQGLRPAWAELAWARPGTAGPARAPDDGAVPIRSSLALSRMPVAGSSPPSSLASPSGAAGYRVSPLTVPRRSAWLAVLLTALAGCALLRGRAPEDHIAVDLGVSRSEAVRRTLAAFREQGYRVRETLTSGTEPETEPFRHGDADAVFRAAVSGSGGAARVVFSGTYRRRELGGLVHGRERAVRRTDDPVERELWARLDSLALTLRRAGP
jgi:hypothetical protein